MAGAGINRRRVGALLRLRARLTLRQFTRERGRIVGAVVALLVFGPMVVGAAIGTAIGYRRLPEPWPAALLGGVLVALWLIWLAFPVIFSSINEGLDVTRLLTYPLSPRDLLVGTLLGTLFDYPTYLVLPLFGAALFGFWGSPAWLLVLVGLGLGYAHMVLMGQLVLTAMGGILQSRRFRDLTIIVASLLGTSCYFINLAVQEATASLTGAITQEQILALRPLNVLQWFPTGAIARSVEQALAGAWLPALQWLGYTAVWLLLIGWAWLHLMNRLATGEGFLVGGLPQWRRREKKSSTAKRARRDWLGWLPADLAQIVSKELKSAWRIPQRRVGLLQGVLLPIVMGGAFIFSSDATSGFAIPATAGLFLPFYALFTFWATTQNMLAWEGRGLGTLLLTPLPRRRIFLGKGIALLLVAGGPFVIIGAGVVGLTRSPLAVLGLVMGLCAGMAAMAVTAVASVLFPIPINVESTQSRGTFSTGGGCRASLAATVLVPIVIGVISLPTALPLAAAWWWERPLLIGVPGLAFSLLYAVAIFWGGSRLAGNLLLEREAEVVAALRQPEESS